MISNTARRSIVRWIHLILSIPILGYVYSPFEAIPNYAPVVGYHIRAVTLVCGLLLSLRALAMMVVSLPLAGLIFAAAAAAFVLAAREAHPLSLDYFFSGDWLPVYMPHR